MYLENLTSCLPQPNLVPRSWHLFCNIIKSQSVPFTKIPICPNECTVIGEFDDSCSVCGQHAWKDENYEQPRHYFQYRSLIAQLKFLFERRPDLIKQIYLYQSQDIASDVQSAAWWKNQEFPSPWHVVVGFWTDGKALYKIDVGSIWPSFLCILSLPPHQIVLHK